MSEFEQALVAMLSPVLVGLAGLIGLIVKDKFDQGRARTIALELKQQAERQQADLDAKAAEVLHTLEKRAVELQSQVEKTAAALAAELAKNTLLTQHAAEQATAAYHEANGVNLKIEKATELGNRQADERAGRE